VLGNHRPEPQIKSDKDAQVIVMLFLHLLTELEVGRKFKRAEFMKIRMRHIQLTHNTIFWE
jgi:hypothetical protein